MPTIGMFCTFILETKCENVGNAGKPLYHAYCLDAEQQPRNTRRLDHGYLVDRNVTHILKIILHVTVVYLQREFDSATTNFSQHLCDIFVLML